MVRERSSSGVEIERLRADLIRVHLPALDWRHAMRPRRRGEVAMVIQRAPGWVLLQTKEHYPRPGIFRLPTGTIQPRETPLAAMLRELHEEANLEPGTSHHLCRLEYHVRDGRQDFFTEIFAIESPRGELKPNDPSEDIGAWREAMLSELPLLAEELRRLEPPWDGWGLFRAVVHDLVPSLLQPRR